MQNFLLNLNDSYRISLFSIPHIILIIVTLLIVTIVICKKNIFKNLSEKQKKVIRYTFGSILVLNMIIRRGSFIYYGVYDWHRNLDINFCNFTSIMFIIYCVSGNKKILNISYHMSFIGPFIAILLPSYNLLPNSYSFYSFLLIHHIIFIFNFIFIFMEDLKWEKKLMPKVLEFLLIYFSTIFVFDYCFNVNYNLPSTFINNSLLNISLINNLSANNISVFIIYFLIIMGLLLLGNKVLKILTKKN